MLLTLLLLGQAFPPGTGQNFNSDSSRIERIARVTRPYGRTAGLAFFEFAPASGAGLGAPCACAAVTGARGESVTFARASAAWCTKDDYSLVSCSNNQPRVMTGSGGTSPKMVLFEDTATNLLTQNRDLSQAVWTKTTMTCALTSTGADGVAASASTCTASGALATVIQTTVVLAATRNSSAYVRRRIGSGTIAVTRDNGGTWTDITASVTATFKRVVSTEAVGCAYGNCIIVPAMTSGIANPAVGFRLGTSTDAIDIDLVQDEPGAFPTSPVTSGASSGVRAAESGSVTVASFSPLSLAFTAMHTGWSVAGQTAVEPFVDGTHFYWGRMDANGTDLGGIVVCYAFNGAGSAGTTTISAAPLGPTPYWCSLASGSTMTVSTLGTSFANATAATAQPFTTILLGNGSGGVLGGLLGGVCLDPGGACIGRGSTHSTAIAWTGDSITFGAAAAPSRPPAVLRGSLPGRTVYNLGIGGSLTAGCVSRAQSAFASGARTLVYLCGVNDMAADATGAATFAAAQVALDQFRLAGRKVVPVLITPWASNAGSTVGRQTQTTAFNAAMQAWCTANSVTCVDTSSLGTGSPSQLAVGNDSGDGLHLNATGATALAALVAAANP